MAVEFFQDFLFQLDMKPRMHLVEINVFSLNNVTIRPTKIMNNAEKKGSFLENQIFLKSKFSKTFFI